MDIKDIYKIHKDKQRENKKIYKMVLDIIHERIMDIAHMNGNQFFYIIPMFVEEKPIFNMREARRSIAHQLKKEGFMVNECAENAIYIYWEIPKLKEPKSNEKRISSKQKKSKSKKRVKKNETSIIGDITSNIRKLNNRFKK